ncbi:MAG TPA: hypothetical protein VMA96_02255 [Solirubrobacteraceae bacterium]|nr:hypothetical protein [Solirubrobacteraceae bacterium]
MLSSVYDRFAIAPATGVRRLMMTAAARALDDGRTEISVSDVLLALSLDRDTGPLLAELGADERAIRAAVVGGA